MDKGFEIKINKKDIMDFLPSDPLIKEKVLLINHEIITLNAVRY